MPFQEIENNKVGLSKNRIGFRHISRLGMCMGAWDIMVETVIFLRYVSQFYYYMIKEKVY